MGRSLRTCGVLLLAFVGAVRADERLLDAAEELANPPSLQLATSPLSADARWLLREGAPGSDAERARAIVARIAEHERRDRLTRLGERALANAVTGADPFVVSAVWAPPFLVCYASGERMGDAEKAAAQDEASRERVLAALRARQERWRPIAEEYAVALVRLHDRFRERYAERFGLRPLTDPWGGAPDLPDGVRSFEDGVPLVVWIFGDRGVPERELGRRGPWITHLSAATGAVNGYEVVGEDRAAARGEVLAAGVRQCVWWYARQRRRWRKPPLEEWETAFGFARRFVAGDGRPDDALESRAYLGTLLREMQETAVEFAAHGEEYPALSLRRLLTGFVPESPGAPTAAQAVLLRQRGFGPGQGSWALFEFLAKTENGARRGAVDRLLEGLLSVEPRDVSLRAAIPEWPDALEPLEQRFRSFVTDYLLRRDPERYVEFPPSRKELAEPLPRLR